MDPDTKHKKKRPYDTLKSHDEWIQHMYNPGYFVNRISWETISTWRWMRKHPKIAGAYVSIPSGTGLFAIIYYMVQEVNAQNITVGQAIFDLLPFSIMVICLIAGIVLFFKTPVKYEQNGITSIPTEKKPKKQPKRRKDYH